MERPVRGGAVPFARPIPIVHRQAEQAGEGQELGGDQRGAVGNVQRRRQRRPELELS